MKHSEHVVLVESAFASLLKKVLLRAVVKKLPYLATGPFNPLLIKLIGWIVGETVQETEMRAFFKFVDFGTAGQATGFEAAMINNYNAQTKGSLDEKNKAESDLDAALGKLWNLKR